MNTLRNFLVFVFSTVVVLQGCVKIQEPETVPTLKNEVYVLEDTTDLKQITFLDDQLGFVINQNNQLYKTTDGGQQWEKTGNPIPGNYSDIHFMDENRIIVKLGTALYVTSDGGTKWDLIRSGVYGFTASGNTLYTMETKLWMPYIYMHRSVDAGETFQEVQQYLFESLRNFNPIKAEFRDGKHFYLFEEYEKYRLIELSEESSAYSTHTLSLAWWDHTVNDFHVFSEQSPYPFMAVGPEGTFWHKDHSSTSFEIGDMYHEWNLYGVDTREDLVLIVGDYTVAINRKPERNREWTLMRDTDGSSFPYHFRDVAFINRNEAIAVAEGGVIVKFDLSYLR